MTLAVALAMVPDMSMGKPQPLVEDGQGLRFVIVAARYNQPYVDALLSSVHKTLQEAGVEAEDIETIRVPGSFELPYVVHMVAECGDHDCVIALGVALEGATEHAQTIGRSTADAFLRTAQETGIPVINGVLVVDSEEQARERCGGSLNRGEEFAHAALEMAELKLDLDRRQQDAYALDEDDLLDDEDNDENGHRDEDWEELLDDDDEGEGEEEDEEEERDSWKS